LPDSYKEDWESIAKKEHPLDEKPFYDDDLTRIGALHKNYRDVSEEKLMKEDSIYTLYMGIDKKLEDEEMIAKLGALDSSISVIE
jgi:hypothetical protein